MDIMKRLDGYISDYRLITVFLAVYLFFQPFKPFTSIREAAFVLLAASLVVRAANGKVCLRMNMKDRAVQAFVLLAAVSLLSVVTSPYPLDSLNAIRKNLFYQAVVFFIVINEYKSFNDLKPVVYSLVGGFALLSLGAVVLNRPAVLFNWLEHNDAPLLSGYSTYAAFYIPLAAAFALTSKIDARIKGVLPPSWAIAAVVALGFALSVLNNHRTQIVAVAVSTLVAALAARRYKILFAGLAAGLVIGSSIFMSKPATFDRYKTLLKPANYASNDVTGWNERLGIWSGVYDMVADRPITGYGYGWKKIANVARDRGYLDRWPEEGSTRLYFTRFGYGAANPHNLALQLLFEIGVLGLGAFVFFWAAVAAKAVSVYTLRPIGEGADFLKCAVPAVLFAYLLINVTNGLWEEVHGVLMVTFAAICVVAYREACGSLAYRTVWVYEQGKG